MKKAIIWGVLGTLVALTVMGCSGSTSESSRIRGRYSQLARNVEQENIGGVMMLFSTDYLDQGYDYVDVRNGFAQLFDTYDNLEDSYIFDDIDVRGNYAIVQGVETLSGANTFKGGQWETSDSDFYDVWRKIGGEWYLYGDQTSGSAASEAARKPLRYSPERMKNAKPGIKK